MRVQPSRLTGLGVAVAMLLAAASSALAQTVVTTTTTAPNAPTTAPSPPASPLLPETGTGVVLGRVIDIGSGKPVAGAIVTIGTTATMTNVTNFGGGPTIISTTPGALNGRPGASTLRVITDTDGRFAFLDLPKGRMSFSVSATGYVGGGYGQRRPTGASQPLELGDGELLGDVTLPVWRYAAIGGTVTDETGEPLVRIPVRLLQRSLVAGRWMLKAAGQSGTTDDRGMYRIGLLVPGEYVVAVATTLATAPLATVEQVQSAEPNNPTPLASLLSRAGAPSSLPGTAAARQIGDLVERVTPGLEPKVVASRTLTYQTVFYPASRTAGDADIVTVASGDERTGIDVQLQLSATMQVRGTVSGPDGPAANLPLKLVPTELDTLAAETGFETATTVSDANGAFTFLGVTPGQYVVRATKTPTSTDSGTRTTTIIDSPRGQSTSTTVTFGGPSVPQSEPTLFANVLVAVGDVDVDHVDAMLRAGPRISGRVEFEGAKERPAPDALKSLFLAIDPSDARALPAGAARGTVDANGQVVTSNLAAGRYLLRASAPAGWTFKAAMYEGRDVSTIPLDVQLSDISGVVFVFTDRPSSVSGTVHDASGVDADTTVLLFPADERLWADNGSNPRGMKTARVTKTGAYSFAAVPGGDYYLAAIADERAGEWPDPKFLASLRASATRIAVADGDQKTQDLRTIK